MNRVRVLIQQDYAGDAGDRRVVTEAIFDSPHFTREQVLDVFENALRGAGYHCPVEALAVVEDEKP